MNLVNININMNMENKKIPVSVGLINFVNCIPINYALEKIFAEEEKETGSEFLFSKGHPVLINSLMNQKQLHIAPVSSVEYLLNTDKYILLKEACISSFGECASVLFFSRCELSELEGKTVALPFNSAASSSMLKVLLKKKGVSYEKIRFGMHKYEFSVKEMLKKYDAVLQIGDEALASGVQILNQVPNDKSTALYKYDLGELWREETGLPAVFGVWAANKNFAVKNPEEIHFFREILSRAIELGLGAYFEDALEEACKHINSIKNINNTTIDKNYIKKYLTARIKYVFSEDHEKSLLVFKEYLDLF